MVIFWVCVRVGWFVLSVMCVVFIRSPRARGEKTKYCKYVDVYKKNKGFRIKLEVLWIVEFIQVEKKNIDILSNKLKNTCVERQITKAVQSVLWYKVNIFKESTLLVTSRHSSWAYQDIHLTYCLFGWCTFKLFIDYNIDL